MHLFEMMFEIVHPGELGVAYIALKCKEHSEKNKFADATTVT